MTRKTALDEASAERQRSRTLSHSAAHRWVSRQQPLIHTPRSAAAMKVRASRKARMVATPCTASPRRE